MSVAMQRPVDLISMVTNKPIWGGVKRRGLETDRSTSVKVKNAWICASTS
jgi:hypothetical protein